MEQIELVPTCHIQSVPFKKKKEKINTILVMLMLRPFVQGQFLRSWLSCDEIRSQVETLIFWWTQVLCSYFPDVPHGFHVTLDKMPAEGEDLKLSCTVSKFLYKDITWILLRTVNNQTTQQSISKQKIPVTKEHSMTFNLVIKNASLEDSGTYACRARNIYTGEEILQKKEVIIRGEHCNKKAVFSRISKFKSTRNDCTTQNNVKH